MHTGTYQLLSVTFLHTTMGSSVCGTAVVPDISHLSLLHLKKELCWMQEDVRGDCSAFYFRGKMKKPGHMFHSPSPESFLGC